MASNSARHLRFSDSLQSRGSRGSSYYNGCGNEHNDNNTDKLNDNYHISDDSHNKYNTGNVDNKSNINGSQDDEQSRRNRSIRVDDLFDIIEIYNQLQKNGPSELKQNQDSVNLGQDTTIVQTLLSVVSDYKNYQTLVQDIQRNKECIENTRNSIDGELKELSQKIVSIEAVIEFVEKHRDDIDDIESVKESRDELLEIIKANKRRLRRLLIFFIMIAVIAFIIEMVLVGTPLSNISEIVGLESAVISIALGLLQYESSTKG